MNINTDYLLDVLTRLLDVPSPTGDTARGIALCRELLGEFAPDEISVTRKGVLLATWHGERDDAPRALTAHIDTLGAVVKEIKCNGRLKLAQLGTFPWTSIENESVTIETQSGETLRGSVVIENGSCHNTSSRDVETRPREQSTLEVRIDARTASAAETRALGIEVGDFVHFDVRLEINHGFIRARHIDDKGCIASVLAAMKVLSDAKRRPAQRTTIHIGTYEEVGHGGSSGVPADVAELLAIDVGPVGAGQNCDEFSCSIGVKDGVGPYDLTLTRKLRRLAAENEIAVRPDVYTAYGSDGRSFWFAGGDARVALLGPGVDNTHGYERTHLDALVATAQLIAAYLIDNQ